MLCDKWKLSQSTEKIIKCSKYFSKPRIFLGRLRSPVLFLPNSSVQCHYCHTKLRTVPNFFAAPSTRFNIYVTKNCCKQIDRVDQPFVLTFYLRMAAVIVSNRNVQKKKRLRKKSYSILVRSNLAECMTFLSPNLSVNYMKPQRDNARYAKKPWKSVRSTINSPQYRGG